MASKRKNPSHKQVHHQAHRQTHSSRFTPHKVWIGFFIFWGFLLTGVVYEWVGGPGLKQYFEVSSLLQETRQRATETEFEIAKMRAILPQLEHNPAAQEREIRKILGYLGTNEVVFEF